MSAKYAGFILTALLLACSGGDEPPSSMVGTGGPGVPYPGPGGGGVPGATEPDEVPPDPAFDQDTEDPPTDPELP
jgi:hypothetical protein